MSVSDLEHEVRERINSPRLSLKLRGDSSKWNTVCAALDVIGDTQMALDAYLNAPQIEELGIRYLYVYGAFQLLQSQQDAVSHLCNAVGLEEKAPGKVARIGSLRSESVAHATKGKKEGRNRVGFIQRISLSQYGFTLGIAAADPWQYETETVNISELVAEQNQHITQVLTSLIKMFDEEDKHRDAHRDDPLSAQFPSTLGYYLSKISEASYDSIYFALGLPHIQFVEEVLENLKTKLEEREIWGAYTGIDEAYKRLEHPLMQLRRYFSRDEASPLTADDVPIFVSFVQNEMRDLKEMAESIDAEYQEPSAGDS
jgi:hypothetical protein